MICLLPGLPWGEEPKESQQSSERRLHGQRGLPRATGHPPESPAACPACAGEEPQQRKRNPWNSHRAGRSLDVSTNLRERPYKTRDIRWNTPQHWGKISPKQTDRAQQPASKGANCSQ